MLNQVLIMKTWTIWNFPLLIAYRYLEPWAAYAICALYKKYAMMKKQQHKIIDYGYNTTVRKGGLVL